MAFNDGKLQIVSKIWPIFREASCDSSKPATKPAKLNFTKRADTDTLKEVFLKYASVKSPKDGEWRMTPKDFVCGFLGLYATDRNYNKQTVDFLAGCADTTKDGLISFDEFQAFEVLLSTPEALYNVAFQLFDTNGSGKVSYDEFEHIIHHTETHKHFPFNFESSFIQLYFGAQLDRQLNYAEFTQLLHDYHEEHAMQAFIDKDEYKDGHISSIAFQEIMVLLKDHLLTDYVRENLIYAAGGENAHLVTYPYFMAFTSLLNQMELVKQIYKNATGGVTISELTKEDGITKAEFLQEAQKFTQLTPMEIDILFQLADLHEQTGKITYDVIKKISPLMDDQNIYRIQKQIQGKVEDMAAGHGRSVLIAVAESAYRFGLGAIAGCIGATAVYPIDLVKTRIQNQRVGSLVGELMYKNSFDCFKKVIRHEGVLGLYRGLPPQLVGVAPEKAIKLTVNDFMRDHLTDEHGNIHFAAEMAAGGCAGGSQVMFTNPLEIVKIRLQVAGEVVSKTRIGAVSVIKELGLFGLYKGAKACFLRDIPFSAIYFPVYAHMKKYTSDSTGYNGAGSLLVSATVAGAPAAYLTTPADVIKTRLQVVAREGQTTYSGVFDCARKIWKEEGPKAFWKGGPARIFRSAPQFGVTLMTYEMLQRIFYVDFGGRRPTHDSEAVEVLPSNPDHIGGYRLAVASIQGIETKFGICFPKFQRTP